MLEGILDHFKSGAANQIATEIVEEQIARPIYRSSPEGRRDESDVPNVFDAIKESRPSHALFAAH